MDLGDLDDLGMESVTIELEPEELELIEDLAFAEFRGNREAAMRDLLDEWLKERSE